VIKFDKGRGSPPVTSHSQNFYLFTYIQLIAVLDHLSSCEHSATQYSIAAMKAARVLSRSIWDWEESVLCADRRACKMLSCPPVLSCSGYCGGRPENDRPNCTKNGREELAELKMADQKCRIVLDMKLADLKMADQKTTVV